GATLPAGGTCTFSVTVAGTTVGQKDNLTGRVTSSAGDGNQAFASISVQQGSVAIEKTSDASPSTTLGSTITYSYKVTNNGSLSITAFTVTDPHVDLSAISCPASSLAPAAISTCTATYVVKQSDVDAGTILNTGTVNASTAGGPVSANDSLTVTLAQTKGVTIKKSSNVSSSTKAGDTITYSYLVTNTGNTTISSLAVTDPHAGLSSIVCPLTTLAPGASTTCTATYHVLQSDVNTGSLTNTGTVNGSTPSGT